MLPPLRHPLITRQILDLERLAQKNDGLQRLSDDTSASPAHQFGFAAENTSILVTGTTHQEDKALLKRSETHAVINDSLL